MLSKQYLQFISHRKCSYHRISIRDIIISYIASLQETIALIKRVLIICLTCAYAADKPETFGKIFSRTGEKSPNSGKISRHFSGLSERQYSENGEFYTEWSSIALGDASYTSVNTTWENSIVTSTFDAQRQGQARRRKTGIGQKLPNRRNAYQVH